MILQNIDWLIIGSYLLFALLVGFFIREKASSNRESYFLANRSLPWWWAGISIAATTFAADTPLAVTGIVARRGISGNWMWLSWIGVHAAVVVIFAVLWRRSEVITDAEFIQLRYSGKPALFLRYFRAGLYGIIYNIIILGWVLRAMSKIVAPFFKWQTWIPDIYQAIANYLPQSSPLGTANEILTIMSLLLIVAVYSSLGGIRGVIFTDLIQFAMSIIGSIWFAVMAWDAIGGKLGLQNSMAELYGKNHTYLQLFPSLNEGWVSHLGLGCFLFGLYLIVQSYANMPADGGGYMMQRLNTCRDEKHAKKAAFLFVIMQYLLRIWPWFIVAAAALVLIPLGAEHTVFDGKASFIANDREMAYPFLMGKLLPPGVLGLLVTSLLAAFMSTIDTHINWGASYIVNDVYTKINPQASPKKQVMAGRISVLAFACAAALVSFQIDTIEQAWRWVAFIGAALGVPTMLRWIWWRVNAFSEILAIIFGLIIAVISGLFTDWPYELLLILTSCASIIGMLAGIFWGPKTDPLTLKTFSKKINPIGFWPQYTLSQSLKSIALAGIKIFGVIFFIVGILQLGCLIIF